VTEESGKRRCAPGVGRIVMLGLGIMGAAMVERLLAQGFQVTGWTRSGQKIEALAGQGMEPAACPARAAGSADVLALCLTDAAAVEAVLFGEDGAAKTINPATVVVDFSTIGVESTREIARRLKGRTGAGWVDAPVSGGPWAAQRGELAILCGGEAADLDLADPVLAALSRVRTHMGPVGAGQAAKLCNQLIVSSAMLAIAEAVSAAKALGLDPAMLPRALAGGYADSLPLQLFGPRMASGECEPRISEVATMLKDVRALNAAVAGKPVNLRLARATLSIYEEAVAEGLGNQDLAALPKLSQSAAA